MRSEIRVFSRNNLRERSTVRELLLPYDEFELYRDLKEKRINDEKGAHLVSRAEQYLEEPIPFLPLSLYRDFFITGVRSAFEAKHHRRRDMLYYLASAEAYERKGRFIERIVDLIWAMLEETSWVIPAHYCHSPNDTETSIPEVYNEEDVPALDLYAGATCSLLATVKYLLEDELNAISPIICKRIDHQIYLRGIRPFIVLSPRWSGETPGFIDNWLTVITADILNACAITVKDPELRMRVVFRAMTYLDNFTAYYPEDGCCDEGPGYWGAAPASFFDCLEIMEDMSGGKINIYGDPMIRKMVEYIVHFNIDGNTYITFADAKPHLEQDGKMIVRYGEKCGSESVVAFGKHVANANPIDRYYFFGFSYRELKDAMEPEVKVAKPTLADTAVWYDGYKIAIFRESSDTSKGLFLATKGGSNGEMHNHNDVGALVVYADGQPIIVDPSIGSYDHGFFGDERYGRWYMKSSYHSVPSVNGSEESVGKEYASKDEVCDLENKTVTMDLAGAFAKDSGIVKMQRTCSLTEGKITVRDEVVAERESDIHFNFLTVNEPRLLSDGKLEVAEGRTLSFDTSLELEIEKVENKWLPYEDLSFRGLWNRECLWRIVLKTKGACATSVITIE